MRTGEEQATLLDEDGHCKYTPRSGRLERARAPLALGAVLLVLWCCGAPPLVLFGSWLLGGRGVQPIIINHGQLTMQVLPVGAIIQKLYVPDKHGKLADIMLGFDEADVGRYTDGTSPYFGAVVGRVANRIANATFRLPGKYGEASHTLARNEGSFPGSLHGGRRGWDKVTWRVEERSSSSVKLTRRSVSGEEGYPGSVDASVTYTLTAENELIAEFAATADAATPINMAQHAYFNLGGHDGKGGSVLEHELTLPGAEHARRRLALATPPPNALPPLSTPPHPRLLPMHPCRNTPSPHQVLPVDAARIPTGEFRAVAGTPFDFTQSRRIGSQIDQVDGPGWRAGYDHCFVLHRLGARARAAVAQQGAASPSRAFYAVDAPQPAAKLRHPPSGRTMEISTTAPGLQVYTSNFLDGSIVGKGGAVYHKYGGVCLETQGFPNAVNTPAFPNSVLEPHGEYRHRTVYKFSVTECFDGNCWERKPKAL